MVSEPIHIRDILVRVPNWIGDAVMSLPAINAIKKVFPDSRISVLAKPWVAPVFYRTEGLHDVIEYNPLQRHARISGLLGIAAKLRRRRFDLSILFQNAFEAALIVYLARIPRRVGYNTDARRFLLTQYVKTNKDKSRHQVDYYMDLIRLLGLTDAASTVPSISLQEDDIAWADNFLKCRNIDEKTILAGIAPGSSYGPAKCWPTDRFSRLSEKLYTKYGVYSLLFGSKSDTGISSLVESGMGVKSENITGKTSLIQAMSLISRCSLFVTNDSGLMHVSVALGVPTLSIFGSTDPDLTAPSGDRYAVIYKSAKCSPCFKRKCPSDFVCMRTISVDEVIEVISDKLLDLSCESICNGLPAGTLTNRS